MEVPVYFRSLHQLYVFSPICQDHMLEGGQTDPKGMFFIVKLGACAYFPFGHLGNGSLGDLEEGRVLTMVLFPHLKWGVNIQSYYHGISPIDLLLLGRVLLEKPQFW